MNMDFNLFTPTKLLFGRGKLNELGNQKLPGRKALLLISSGQSVKTSGTLDRVTAQLDKAGAAYVICNNIHENPSKEVVMEAAACAKGNGCDFILALGGGAVLDSAVAVAAMATNPGDLWDYVCGGTGKAQPLLHPGLPIVTIATTSGTGSEINCWGVISNHETNEKIGFGDPSLNPVLAIVDPELMRTVPAEYTAYQGFDALFHNTEVMISRFVNVLSGGADSVVGHRVHRRILAPCGKRRRRHRSPRRRGLRQHHCRTDDAAHQHYRRTFDGARHERLPPRLAARRGADYDFQRVLPLFRGTPRLRRFVKMARAMGMKDANKPEDFLTALAELQKACGVDNLRMSDYGITKEECDTLARNARETMGGLFAANPCEMTHEDCADIFEKSYR